MKIVMHDLLIKMSKKAKKGYRNRTRNKNKKITLNAASRRKSRSWKNIENSYKKKKRNSFEKSRGS